MAVRVATYVESVLHIRPFRVEISPETKCQKLFFCESNMHQPFAGTYTDQTASNGTNYWIWKLDWSPSCAVSANYTVDIQTLSNGTLSLYREFCRAIDLHCRIAVTQAVKENIQYVFDRYVQYSLANYHGKFSTGTTLKNMCNFIAKSRVLCCHL